MPHCLGAVGSGFAAMQCLPAWGQWAVELPQCTATMPRALGNGTPAMYRHTAWWQGALELVPCTVSPRAGVVGHGTRSIHCHSACGKWARIRALHCLTARGQWAVVLVLCTASSSGGTRQRICAMRSHTTRGHWISYYAVPHCLRAVGSGTRAMHCHNARGQLAVDLVQCTATLRGGSGH